MNGDAPYQNGEFGDFNATNEFDDDMMNYGLAGDDDDLFGDGEINDGQFDNFDQSFDENTYEHQDSSGMNGHNVEMGNSSAETPAKQQEIPTIPDEEQMVDGLADFLGDENAAMAGLNFKELEGRALETGDKDENAVDYEDISDDDLPDEEETSAQPVRPPDSSFLSGINESAAEADDSQFDDLFEGDDDPDLFGDGEDQPAAINGQDPLTKQTSNAGMGTLAALAQRDEEMTEEETAQWIMQQSYLSGKAFAKETDDDNDAFLRRYYPAYDRNSDNPYWNRIFPQRQGHYPVKEPKRPRPIRPTKLTFEIEADQRILFTAPANIAAPVEKRPDLVHFVAGPKQDGVEFVDDHDSEEEELPGSLTSGDLDLMCTDFDKLSHLSDGDELDFAMPRIVGEDATMSDHESERPLKKRRLSASDLIRFRDIDIPSLDDPERMTARIAREVVLDMNDPHLLLEELDPEILKQRGKVGDISNQATSIKDRLARRFRTSNDASYEALQQNQNRVRGQLTNMAIDHSVPAIRLQYPYYQVKLGPRELRNWHRRSIVFKHNVAFHKINKQKRKEIKNKPVGEVFTKTRDLSVADNSYTLLLEYSEEYPTMLSQTGMGNKVVNYYRKKDANDALRPKADIGDTSVLMPEDKSPFHNFGHIEPGEQTLALYNTLYRAPIFKQNTKLTDFLVVREVTGMNGQVHYLRNVDYQYVVGQELPSQVVPGPSARLVTTVSKNRLKAISYRIARRKKNHRLRVEEVTRHFPETNDMQNRQKMKEFMKFNKDHKEWEMADSAPIPEESEIQKSILPEDICLIESMQVGNQYLHDSGYADDDGDDEKEDNDSKTLSIEQQLAPWKTTKNFRSATEKKSMLSLFGEGDPSGRGEAFSFQKTSMKGGFHDQGQSTANMIAKSRAKDKSGSHTYNVADQQAMYDNAIRRIWNKQKAALSSMQEPESDDEGVDAQIESGRRKGAATPGPSNSTPKRGRNDETDTSLSKRSAQSQTQKFLRIRRKIFNKEEDAYEYRDYIETDPAVIAMYLKRRRELDKSVMPQTLVPTGDPEVDARQKQQYSTPLILLTTLLTFIDYSLKSTDFKALSQRRNDARRRWTSRSVKMVKTAIHRHLQLVAGTSLALNANVLIVVKWVTSRPTKSQ